jgi:poly-gamma-glutamate synthesis protein (capsule biosynthesis protein)
MPQVQAARKSDGSYDYTASFEHIAPMFRNADIAVLNLETTISSSGRCSGYPLFASPIAIADAMVDMGIDIALLANNHCCDRYGKGIDTTIDELTRRNIAHIGVYKDSTDYRDNNIYHFDLTTRNILYNPNTMAIQIVDFEDSVRVCDSEDRGYMATMTQEVWEINKFMKNHVVNCVIPQM